jgi:iron complex transport system substrate-binding protein
MYLSFGGSVGANTFIHDVLVTSGTTNVVAEAGQTGFLQQVNAELVVERDPQYLLVSSRRDPALSRAPFNATTAVEQDQLAVVNVNYLAQPAPRSVVFAVRNVTETVHGDVYGPADYVSRQAAAQTATATPTATATATATDTSTAGPTTTATATETPTDGGGQAQPGFGVAVAVLAVLGALALLRRRE